MSETQEVGIMLNYPMITFILRQIQTDSDCPATVDLGKTLCSASVGCEMRIFIPCRSPLGTNLRRPLYTFRTTNEFGSLLECPHRVFTGTSDSRPGICIPRIQLAETSNCRTR